MITSDRSSVIDNMVSTQHATLMPPSVTAAWHALYSRSKSPHSSSLRMLLSGAIISIDAALGLGIGQLDFSKTN